eukprot:scaffold4092_cov105-Skeletonema_dohrnii-CCMP3373.AAC.2
MNHEIIIAPIIHNHPHTTTAAMDNNAFRTLVNQQLKSTKEIAREAVESEFRQKKQKRGGRSRVEYDSDSASDDDDLTKRRREGDHKKSGEEVSDEPEWKRRRKEKATATTGGGGRGQWRDRAKERREGKNLDYNDAVTTSTIHSNAGGDDYTDKKRQAELSKFLGGDEEHTHLVKGLDLALAQRVRREEMGVYDAAADGREEDLDQLLEDAYNTQQKESLELKSKQSSSIAVIQPKSELGKSVQHYLLKKQQQQQQQQQRHNNHSAATTTTQQQSIQINPTKQNSIQRSHYTFSLDSTIQKRHDAWDVPQLQMIGGGQQEQSLFEKRGMTTLDCHLIATIRKKLDGALNKGGGGGKRKEVNDGGVDKSDDGMKQQQLQQPSSSLDKDVNDKEQSHQEDNLITEKTPISNLLNNKKDDSDDDDDDSDDDIFADVGAYVPPRL